MGNKQKRQFNSFTLKIYIKISFAIDDEWIIWIATFANNVTYMNIKYFSRWNMLEQHVLSYSTRVQVPFYFHKVYHNHENYHNGKLFYKANGI
jgi:hypothetical protein